MYRARKPFMVLWSVVLIFALLAACAPAGNSEATPGATPAAVEPTATTGVMAEPTATSAAAEPTATTEAAGGEPTATQAADTGGDAAGAPFTIGISNPFISSEYRTQMIQELKDVNTEYMERASPTTW